MRTDSYSDGLMGIARREMIAVIRRRGVSDEAVLSAMALVRRDRFFPTAAAPDPEIAYGDFPVSIGNGQTISQPYIVAYMTEALALQPGERVLEIGTGSGYQAAVLAGVSARVWTIERQPALAARARRVLDALDVGGVQVRVGDGYDGWREEAPFDGILLTCAPPEIPASLMEQLAEGGRMIAPVGPVRGAQQLVRVRREAGRLSAYEDLPVAFVPMLPGVNVVAR